MADSNNEFLQSYVHGLPKALTFIKYILCKKCLLKEYIIKQQLGCIVFHCKINFLGNSTLEKLSIISGFFLAIKVL